MFVIELFIAIVSWRRISRKNDISGELAGVKADVQKHISQAPPLTFNFESSRSMTNEIA